MNGNVYGYSYFQSPPPPFPQSPSHKYNRRCGPPPFTQDYSVPPPFHDRGISDGYRNYSYDYREQYYKLGSRYDSQFAHQRNQKRYNKRDAFDFKRTLPQKKKPLSRTMPNNKDWTIDEAALALKVEKEYSKQPKNQNLILKFPDAEVNKEIVSNLHPGIRSVQFVTPSTARFCFVTLKQTAKTDAVISELNRLKLGSGYLLAEFKKNGEGKHVIVPEDLDPLTLYVGNLNWDVTKDDILKLYPTSKRIDIGYAMKAKYTRYAFVAFDNLNDCIEAFKRTHSTDMHSKTLIVRFRRIHSEFKAQETKAKVEPSGNGRRIEDDGEDNDVICLDDERIADLKFDVKDDKKGDVVVEDEPICIEDSDEERAIYSLDYKQFIYQNERDELTHFNGAFENMTERVNALKSLKTTGSR